ncbi:hypothetical protein V2I01_00110 [Micromonospora sp. BRA006-A]|nr:hypothetical protein [Micromonospora sp. BRA006-A]
MVFLQHARRERRRQILSDDGKKAEMDAGGPRARPAPEVRHVGRDSPSFSNAPLEDPVRLEFQSGKGAFQVNWPFVYPALQEANPDLAKNVKWARAGHRPGHPQQYHRRGHLAVSTYRKHPSESLEAARCLRNAENQSSPPTTACRPPSRPSTTTRDRGVPDEGDHPGGAEGWSRRCGRRPLTTRASPPGHVGDDPVAAVGDPARADRRRAAQGDLRRAGVQGSSAMSVTPPPAGAQAAAEAEAEQPGGRRAAGLEHGPRARPRAPLSDNKRAERRASARCQARPPRWPRCWSPRTRSCTRSGCHRSASTCASPTSGGRRAENYVTVLTNDSW